MVSTVTCKYVCMELNVLWMSPLSRLEYACIIMTIYEKMDHLGLFVYIQWEIF